MDGFEAAIGTSFFSVPIPMEQVDSWRLVFSCPATGTPTGTLSIQVSNDEVLNATLTPNSGDLPTAFWNALPIFSDGAATPQFSAQYAGTATPTLAFPAVAGAATFVFDDNRCNYAWMRLSYVVTSGTMIPRAKTRLKGIMGR
jgi:hypothetical protein